jgi:hypothetical protein
LFVYDEFNLTPTRLASGRTEVHCRPVSAVELSVRPMTEEELLVQQLLYHTVVDCFKIAISEWRHFIPMRWSREKDDILSIARRKTLEWIESDRFAFYAKFAGWNPVQALAGLRELLGGKCDALEIAALIKQIGKERDYRRDRGIHV